METETEGGGGGREEYTRFDKHLLAFHCSSAIGLFIV
jgi:hypothetical protein